MKKATVLVLTAITVLILASCGAKRPSDAGGTEISSEPISEPANVTEPDTEPAADDFSFYVIWGTYGKSSYYSDTGKLTKTTDSLDGNYDKYVTTVELDKETAERFRAIITALDLDSYPSADYDPGCGYSDPSAKLVLSYTEGGRTHTVSTIGDLSIDYRKADNEKGQAFLDAVNEITGYLTSTPEWEALPDYELFYD